MHAKKSRTTLPAILAIFGLLFGSLIGISGTALAAGSIPSGCANAKPGQNPNCNAYFDVEFSTFTTNTDTDTYTREFTSSTANPLTTARIGYPNCTTKTFSGATTSLLDWTITTDSGTGAISVTSISTTVNRADVAYTVTGTCTYGSPATTYTDTATITLTFVPGTITEPTPEPEPTVEPEPTSSGGGSVEDRKVTICHRTHATTNPYVRITVDYNSVNKKSGHQGHDEIFAGEHVFKAGIYTRAKDKDWGDIIPADPTGFDRWQPLNWTTLGAAIYKGTVAGCPAYDAVKYYNAMREAGVPEKQIKKEIGELETEQSEAEPTRTKKDESTMKYTGTNTKALEQEKDKVTICHRTNSTTNPYVKITVAASSIYKNAGHYGHDEIYNGHHVFDSAVTYPNNKKDWGDIIPADPTGQNRWQPLNMTTLGKAIYNGTAEGCAEKTTQQIYNELREEGKSKKEIMDDLEKQKNIDEDPKDLDELTYTGKDPEVEKSEPKEPVEPANVKIPDQSLSGIVWLDLNRDGLKDPNEPFMPNITLTVVQLTSVVATPTPARVQSSALRATATDMKAAAVTLVKTDANGFYIFPSLGAGDWQVVTTVPDALEVTYDSHATSDGEIITTVPVASHAFTWVGLVGDDPKVNKAIVDALDKAGPGSTVQVDENGNVYVVKKSGTKAPVKAGELAATGSNELTWLAFGMLMMLCGALMLVSRRASQS